MIDKLRDPIRVKREEIVSQVSQMVEEIQENGQQNGRTTEQLVKNVISGVILETAFAKATGGEINRRTFDPSRPKTFAYDVSIGETTFEIKPSPKVDTWFNFNIKGAMNASDNQLSRADLSTYMKYKDWVDWVVVGYYDTVEKGKEWVVKFKWIIDSETFDIYTKTSRAQSSGTTHYYDVKTATKRGVCVDLR